MPSASVEWLKGAIAALLRTGVVGGLIRRTSQWALSAAVHRLVDGALDGCAGHLDRPL